MGRGGTVPGSDVVIVLSTIWTILKYACMILVTQVVHKSPRRVHPTHIDRMRYFARVCADLASHERAPKIARAHATHAHNLFPYLNRGQWSTGRISIPIYFEVYCFRHVYTSQTVHSSSIGVPIGTHVAHTCNPIQPITTPSGLMTEAFIRRENVQFALRPLLTAPLPAVVR